MASHEQLRVQGREIIQRAPQLYFDVDVEADGIPGFGSLLSVGAVSPWGEEFYAELKPSSDRYLEGNRQFCEDHNLKRERLLDEGRDPSEVIEEFHGWVGDITTTYDKKRPVFTAFNASFDFPWVDLAMKEAGILKNPFGVTGYCIQSLANQLSGDYDWRKTSKDNWPAELVPEGDFTHNALEDAIYQQKMHQALVGILKLEHNLRNYE